MPSLPSRTHPRWSRCDYRRAGLYFVTAVSHGRRPLFGSLTSDGVALSPAGVLVDHTWRRIVDMPGVALDAFVVMPDHVHAIIELADTRARLVGLSQIVGWAKQQASRAIVTLPFGVPGSVWQRSFYDRIIRDAAALAHVRRYIADNPRVAWERHGAVSVRRSGE